MTVNPLVIEEAGVPGAPNSYWSELQEPVTTGGGANDLITAIGWLQVIAKANHSYKLRTDISPETLVTVLAANTAGMLWSDGSNLFVTKSSGGAGTASFYILQHKP